MQQRKQELICDEMTDNIVKAAEKIAIEEGIKNLTVRKILNSLSITNRVFYNRFRNIDEVLGVIYKNVVIKLRDSIKTDNDPEGDYFKNVTDIAANTLIMSYDYKMNFYNHIRENDSVSYASYSWWKNEIMKLIEFGKEKKLLKNLDTEAISYAVWCFIRGYNEDAIVRKLPRDKAIADFRYSLGVFLDGMRAK